MKNAIDYNLKNIYLTTFKNKSDRFYNIIWDNYYQSQNCRSINTYINLDYKNYKKKAVLELNNIAKNLNKNKSLNNSMNIENNFNFLNISIINEKVFIKINLDL